MTWQNGVSYTHLDIIEDQEREITHLKQQLEIAKKGLIYISRSKHGMYCDQHSDVRARQILAKLNEKGE